MGVIVVGMVRVLVGGFGGFFVWNCDYLQIPGGVYMVGRGLDSGLYIGGGRVDGKKVIWLFLIHFFMVLVGVIQHIPKSLLVMNCVLLNSKCLKFWLCDKVKVCVAFLMTIVE
jgi:hypothetical protein